MVAMTNNSPFLALPDELLCLIFSYLRYGGDLCAIKVVNRRCHLTFLHLAAAQEGFMSSLIRLPHADDALRIGLEAATSSESSQDEILAQLCDYLGAERMIRMLIAQNPSKAYQRADSAYRGYTEAHDDTAAFMLAEATLDIFAKQKGQTSDIALDLETRLYYLDIRKGRRQEAQVRLENIVKAFRDQGYRRQGPLYEFLVFQLLQCYSKEDDPEGAEARAEDMIKELEDRGHKQDAPVCSPWLGWLSACYAWKGRTEEADELKEWIVTTHGVLQPEPCIPVLQRLLDLYFEAGDTGKARTLIESMIKDIQLLHEFALKIPEPVLDHLLRAREYDALQVLLSL